MHIRVPDFIKLFDALNFSAIKLSYIIRWPLGAHLVDQSMLVNLSRRPHRLHAEARVVHGVGEYLALQAEPGPPRVRGALLALERVILRRQHVPL